MGLEGALEQWLRTRVQTAFCMSLASTPEPVAVFLWRGRRGRGLVPLAAGLEGCIANLGAHQCVFVMFWECAVAGHHLPLRGSAQPCRFPAYRGAILERRFGMQCFAGGAQSKEKGCIWVPEEGCSHPDCYLFCCCQRHLCQLSRCIRYSPESPKCSGIPGVWDGWGRTSCHVKRQVLKFWWGDAHVLWKNGNFFFLQRKLKHLNMEQTLLFQVEHFE